MNAYEQKKAARIERLEQRADSLRVAADGAMTRARKMADIIPFGQPILVGHHSEGRDRRYRERIRKTMDKSVALYREAKEAEARAIAAAKNNAISSDDPEAIDKLREKAFGLKSDQARMVLVNQALRAAKTDEEISALVGLKASTIASLREPDFCGRTGFADYELRNNGANIRRIEKRIAALETRAAAPEKAPEEVGDVRIVEEKNRVRVFFPGKPSGETRANLKRCGFRWSPTVGAWQAYPSAEAWATARKWAEIENAGKVVSS